jgi:hypothetical protein
MIKYSKFKSSLKKLKYTLTQEIYDFFIFQRMVEDVNS